VYGTLARMKIKRENLEALRAAAEERRGREVPGYRASYVLVPDDWNDEIVLAVMFDDKESYTKNAHDPATNEDFVKMRALLEDDPEWTDGEWREG